MLLLGIAYGALQGTDAGGDGWGDSGFEGGAVVLAVSLVGVTGFWAGG